MVEEAIKALVAKVEQLEAKHAIKTKSAASSTSRVSGASWHQTRKLSGTSGESCLVRLCKFKSIMTLNWKNGIMSYSVKSHWHIWRAWPNWCIIAQSLKKPLCGRSLNVPSKIVSIPRNHISTLQAKSCRPDKDLHEMRYKLVELACRDDMASLTPMAFTRESVGFGS